MEDGDGYCYSHGEAMSSYLMCMRFAEDISLPTDSKHLISLGDKLVNLVGSEIKYGRGSFKDEGHGCYLDSLEGRTLAFMIDDELSGKKECHEKAVKNLRALGIDNLVKLGEALKLVEDGPEFKKYAEALGEFFKYWGECADELSVTLRPKLDLRVVILRNGGMPPLKKVTAGD